MISKMVFPFFLLIGVSAQAADKCFEVARKAAITYAVQEGYITRAQDFRREFGDEFSDIETHHGSWHQEYHIFSNSSMGIRVDADFAKGRCFVKNVTWFQNDQDWE